MDRARNLIEEQLKFDLGDDYDSILETKTEDSEPLGMYFRGSKEYDLIQNKKSTVVIDNIAHEFRSQKNFLKKNVKKCQKIESTLNDMFKN